MSSNVDKFNNRNVKETITVVKENKTLFVKDKYVLKVIKSSTIR
jgi:hypothetical protein